MSGPSAGNVIAGVFLILLALVLVLAGGGCTVMLFLYMSQGSPGEMLPLLLVSLAVLAGGATAGWFGVRLIIGRYD